MKMWIKMGSQSQILADLLKNLHTSEFEGAKYERDMTLDFKDLISII